MPTTPLMLVPLLVPCGQDTPAEAPARAFEHWHASHAAAVEAAAESGKPVLLFELFGRLDEEFC